MEELFKIVSQIPHGKVVSYGDLGKALNNPVSGLIVGKWMANCPPELPWWRVITKKGVIAIFNRDPALGILQRELLKKEGVPFLGDLVDVSACLVDPYDFYEFKP